VYSSASVVNMPPKRNNGKGKKVSNSPRRAATNPVITNRRLFRQELAVTLGTRSGADVYTIGSAQINLRALTSFNEAAAGYDLYKLQEVRVYALPMGPTNASTNLALQPLYTAPNTLFYSYVDPAYEPIAGSSQQTIINATNCQWKSLSINNIKLVAKWKPNITQSLVTEPVLNALVRGKNTWVNTQTNIVRWNAIKFYCVLAGGTSVFPDLTNSPRVRLIVEYDVDFKIPRQNITLPTLPGPVFLGEDCGQYEVPAEWTTPVGDCFNPEASSPETPSQDELLNVKQN